ncbi:hypothetical protein Taro_053388 [Colocasia esculenta]|uniref:Uncharacterized protein n=1 Tax=Colocasia esculenta TaxID=4460 RepID=A0A843XMN6_COLES|nr:hypothetical protein [Colocasia esculenta]
MSLELAGVMWRSSWWLESRRSSIPSSSSSTVHLLRPVPTTFLKPIKEQPCVKRRKDWSAIQSTVLALSGSGTDPANVTAR